MPGQLKSLDIILTGLRILKVKEALILKSTILVTTLVIQVRVGTQQKELRR